MSESLARKICREEVCKAGSVRPVAEKSAMHAQVSVCICPENTRLRIAASLRLKF